MLMTSHSVVSVTKHAPRCSPPHQKTLPSCTAGAELLWCISCCTDEAVYNIQHCFVDVAVNSHIDLCGKMSTVTVMWRYLQQSRSQCVPELWGSHKAAPCSHYTPKEKGTANLHHRSKLETTEALEMTLECRSWPCHHTQAKASHMCAHAPTVPDPLLWKIFNDSQQPSTKSQLTETTQLNKFCCEIHCFSDRLPV